MQPTVETAASQSQAALTAARLEQINQASLQRDSLKYVNNLLFRYDENTPFHNRTVILSKIIKGITGGVRLITIYGRAGTGKTGLANKALSDLENAPDSPDGMVYLTGSGAIREFSLGRIINDFEKLLGSGVLSIDAQTSAEDKVFELLNALRGSKYVLLLDNFEVVQDAITHEITDPEIAALIEGTLRQGGLTIVITSRFPLVLDALLKSYELSVPIDGLPREHSVHFLRSLDRSGRLPKKDAQLHILIKRTLGFPRALEAAVGTLSNNPTISFKDLISDVTLFTGEITVYIVQKAIDMLPTLFTRIMEALSVYHHPVGLPALKYLLSPYLDMVNVPIEEPLDRLVASKFVNFNPHTHQYVLHSIDREYCYSCIPEGTVESEQISANVVYTRISLNQRAADFYLQLRSDPKTWRSITHITPILLEYQHRVQAKQYDDACKLLGLVDFEYLYRWGYYRYLASLRNQLKGNLTDTLLDAENVGNLGRVYRSLGQTKEAILSQERALSLVQSVGNRLQEGIWLANLGSNHRDLGDLQQALELQTKALTIFEEVGDRRWEGICLSSIGSSRYALGQMQPAIEFFERSVAVARDIGDVWGVGYRLGHLSKAYYSFGEMKKASELYQEGLRASREVGDLWGQSDHLIGLGKIQLITGKLSVAQKHFQEALDLNVAMNVHYAALLLAITLLNQGESTATEVFSNSIDRCRTRLRKNDLGLFAVRLVQATALVGKAVCDPGWKRSENREELLAPSLNEYRQVMKTTVVPGAIRDVLEDLALIQNASVGSLESVITLLTSSL